MTDIVLALSAVFITAGVLLLAANHFGLSPIPFYIIAGLITGTVVAQPDIVELAQWGIAFLVFVFGIRVDLQDVQAVMRHSEIAAFAQLAVVGSIGLAIGYGLGLVFDIVDPARNAIYFAAAASLSSTIIGAGALESEIRDNLVHGRLASSIHFFDDMVAIMAILVLSAETLTDQQLITSNIGYGVLFLIAGLVLYRHGFPLLVRLADGVDELILMGSISILIAFMAAAEAVGISIVIGAFTAGIAIRGDGVEALGVQNGIQSIRDFFVAIFFVTVGALVQVPTVETLVLAGVLLVLVLVVNPLVYTLAFIFEGYDKRTAFLASSNLSQMSELSLIIAIQGLLLGTISERLFDAIILAAALTMILTVGINRYEDDLYEQIVARVFTGRHTRYIDRHSDVEDDLSDHVVVIGYGRLGRSVVRTLKENDVPYVVVENDPLVRDELQARCRHYVFGDAMADYPLELAKAEQSQLVISTVDLADVSESLLERYPDNELILRADSSRTASHLLNSGATFVTVPSVLAADRLVETIERTLEEGVDPDAIREEQFTALDELHREGLTTHLDRP